MSVRTIEHRRHTMRRKPGKHLSQAGVDRARRVGEALGHFDLVVTSSVARAFETAIAMGYAVDERLDELAAIPDEVMDEVDWWKGCAAFARAAPRGGAVADYCREMGRLMRGLAKRLPDGGRALVVSHGGIVEAATVGALPDFDYTSFGHSCSFCEGTRLFFDGGHFVSAEILRVPEAAEDKMP
jgi:broad specificity phosphatase PhoE